MPPPQDPGFWYYACHDHKRAKNVSLRVTSLFGRIETGRDRHGNIDAEIPRASIDFYAARLLGVGTDVEVESPPEVIRAMREGAQAVARLYTQDAGPKDDAPPPTVG